MTVQPTNPLIGAQPIRPGRVTLEALEDMAVRFNRQPWVQDRGWHYYVGKSNDGKATLERNERRG